MTTPRLLIAALSALGLGFALGIVAGFALSVGLVFWRSGAGVEPVDDGWRDLEGVDAV